MRKSPRVALARKSRPAPRARLLQALEGRVTPTTYTVTTLADGGAGSLRDAITQANGNAGADVINFQAGLTGTISLTTNDGATDPSGLTISDSVTVNGPGPGLLTVRRDPAAASQFRVFNVNGAGVLNVTLSGMTISGGNSTGAGGSGP